jgi:hypothetical protein
LCREQQRFQPSGANTGSNRKQQFVFLPASGSLLQRFTNLLGLDPQNDQIGCCDQITFVGWQGIEFIGKQAHAHVTEIIAVYFFGSLFRLRPIPLNKA